MKIEVLVSTMNLENPIELLDRMNIKSDAVIIDQCSRNYEEKIEYNGFKIRIYGYNERGLSNSRNHALEKIAPDTDIAIIADDNVRYEDNYVEIVSNCHKENDEEIIAFYIKRNDDRTTKKTTKKIGYITSMRISSPQITFKVKSIKDKKIIFDKNFGTGTEMYMGEENIFLFDCLRKGVKIINLSTKLGEKLNVRKSTWFNGVDEKHLFVKGACFYRMSKFGCPFLSAQFVLRKYPEYKGKVSFINAIKTIRKGKKHAKNNGFVRR